MPTTKQRINLTVSADMNRALTKLAKRDRISVATKTLDLVHRALEIEEDAALLAVVTNREKEKGKSVSHRQAWV